MPWQHSCSTETTHGNDENFFIVQFWHKQLLVVRTHKLLINDDNTSDSIALLFSDYVEYMLMFWLPCYVDLVLYFLEIYPVGLCDAMHMRKLVSFWSQFGHLCLSKFAKWFSWNWQGCHLLLPVPLMLLGQPQEHCSYGTRSSPFLCMDGLIVSWSLIPDNCSSNHKPLRPSAWIPLSTVVPFSSVGQSVILLAMSYNLMVGF